MADNPADADLIELGTKTPLGPYLKEMWDRREFAIVVPANDIRAQNMDTFLGQLWHLLNPLMLIGVYYIIFGVVLKTSRGVENFLGFLVVGILIFQLSQRAIQEAAASIRRNESLIRSIQFPRSLLPVSAVTGQTIAFIPSLVVLLSFVLITGERPTLRWLLLPIILLGQALFGVGASFIIARIGFAVTDIQQILPHLFRLLFYMSGVIFSVEVFITNTTMQNLFALNPMYDIITAARWALMGLPLPVACVVGLVLWALLLPIAGLLFFRAREHRYGA
ncbi:MAG TPA: ABC transporter permease [Acidimicrobiia bacterium]|jgi:teichoic acid transport system permease protein|nr:ABC transporter permease [Acidimicrobiia bacterium]